MIAVFGLGFVGLTTALGFSEKGFQVYGYDIDKNKVNSLSSHKIPFYEQQMQEILDKNLNKNFQLSNDIKTAVDNSKIIFLCVGTPSDKDGKADLKYIKSAISDILSNLQKGEKKLLVFKSTIPPSTTKNEIIPYIESKGFVVGKDIFVANNPEFLREGYAWSDFINPDRIILGVEDDYSKSLLTQIYSKFNVDIHYVSLNTSEFIKYLSNTLLSTLISYSNEMSMIASSIGNIDIKTAFNILHEDKRWSGSPCTMQTYTYPGCGFGGYCLPKDTQAMVYKAKEYGYDAKILKNVLDVNSEIKPFWIDKIEKEIPKSSSLGILGLSFKPNSDDIRQTPAKMIIEMLLEKGYKNINVYDPLANELFDKTYSLPLNYLNSVEDIVSRCDTLIITTAWNEFMEKQELFSNKKVYDLRYILKGENKCSIV
ncbi:MAG: UDP-glucose/GDP-mannose dehydrogenase family protein [Candidatus Gastranaerophilales bacterium]|nr:UDP-glucose/GDP-mannose dehydrogenase family protein [Candidatus Gastranaerophilales bacterium]